MGPMGFNKLGLDLGEGEPIGLGLEKSPNNFEMGESSNQTKDWLRIKDMSHVHYEGRENQYILMTNVVSRLLKDQHLGLSHALTIRKQKIEREIGKELVLYEGLFEIVPLNFLLDASLGIKDLLSLEVSAWVMKHT